MFVRAAVILYVFLVAMLVFIPVAFAVTVNADGTATITKSEMQHCTANGGCLILTGKQLKKVAAEIRTLKSLIGKTCVVYKK